MRNYRNTNDKTIENSFARLSGSYGKSVQEGMRRMLDMGMEYALLSHDQQHRKHVENGDSYGWAMWHDGSVVETRVRAKSGKEEASVDSGLRTMKPPSSSGWCGVIMAAMQPRYWFSLDYENDILNMTAAELRANFHKYFKQL